MRRSDQRRDAVFACYQRDVTGRPLDELLADAKPFTRELAEGVEAHRDRARRRRSPRHAKGWDLDRIAPLDRNIMRVALYEIAHRDDVPTEVAIDEAVELAKDYCGADAPGFVNGVLGAAVRAGERVRGEPAGARSPSASEAITARAGGRRHRRRAGRRADREAAELAAEAVEEVNRRTAATSRARSAR